MHVPMHCPSCGKPLPPGTISCPHCHTLVTAQHTGTAPVVAEPVQPPPFPPQSSQPEAVQPVAAAPVDSAAPLAAPAAAPLYAAATQVPPAVQSVAPASRWKRFGNYLVDLVAQWIISFVVTLTITLQTTAAGSSFNAGSFGFSILMSMGILFAYYVVCESLFSRTLGKLITGTKVVNLDGSKPSPERILIRTLCRLIPFEPLSFFRGGYPRGWHDQFSGTTVVPAHYTPAQVQAIGQDTSKSSGGWIVVLIVGTLVGIALVGIVSSVVLASLGSAREKGRDARRIADVKQIQLAAELYIVDNGKYPSTLADIGGQYIASIPVDPANGAQYYYSYCPATGFYHIGADLDSDYMGLADDADQSNICDGDFIAGGDSASCNGAGAGHCLDYVGEPVSESVPTEQQQ